MLDGFKFGISLEEHALEFYSTHPAIQWRQVITDPQTGNLLERTTKAKRRKEEEGELHFKIDMLRRELEVTGSFHKYYNRNIAHIGGNNHTPYTFSQFVDTVIHICQTYSINPYPAQPHSLELGVNIEPPIPTADILAHALTYRHEEHRTDNGYGRRAGDTGRLRAYDTANYYFKHYNKGLQYGLKHECYRVEIKAKRMQYFASKGQPIKSLADLLNPEIIFPFGQYLIKAHSNIQFDTSMFPISSYKGWNAYDKRAWNRLKDKREITKLRKAKAEKDVKARNRLYKRMRELLSTRPEVDYLTEIENRIAHKLQEINIVTDEVRAKITSFLSLYSPDQSESVFNLLTISNNPPSVLELMPLNERLQAIDKEREGERPATITARPTRGVPRPKINKEDYSDKRERTAPLIIEGVRVCANPTCCKPFEPKRKDGAYCSKACRNEITNAERHPRKRKKMYQTAIKDLNKGSDLFGASSIVPFERFMTMGARN